MSLFRMVGYYAVSCNLFCIIYDYNDYFLVTLNVFSYDTAGENFLLDIEPDTFLESLVCLAHFLSPLVSELAM